MTATKPGFSVSVVIPLYNKQDAIERTISSVLKQSRPAEELIIVDDGSSDNSAEIAERFLSGGESNTDWRIISQANSGVSVARNRGANEARSRYIAFLDADDEWLPDYLSEMERLARSFPSATVLTVRNAMAGANGRLVPRPSPLKDGFFGILERPLDAFRRGYGVVHTSSIVIRDDAWERHGGFPVGAKKSQEMFLWLKLGVSEVFAHSGKPLSILRREHTGIGMRSGAVPYHLSYFLGTREGRRCLNDPDLVSFLASNLMVQIAAHRLTREPEVARQLRGLAAALPRSARVKCWAASVAPMPLLDGYWWLRKRRRGLGE